MTKESFFRSLFKEGVNTALFEALKWLCALGLPPLLTAATIVAGYLQGIPWAYIIAAAAFVFAATATGLLRFDEWRIRRTPRNKVGFVTFAFGFDYARDAAGKAIALTKAQVSLILKNDATFPVHYVVDEIISSIDGRVNQKPTYTNKGGHIGAGSVTTYRDDVIDMQNVPMKKLLDGTLKFKLRYGMKGKEKYPIEMHINIGTGLDPDSGMYRPGAWTTVAERI